MIKLEQNVRVIAVKLSVVILVFAVCAFLFLRSFWVQIPQDNVCQIFSLHPTWYKATSSAENKWFVPMSTQMAIIHQESHFRPHVRPGSGFLQFLGFGGSSSAVGYAQALDSTWKSYLSHNKIEQANRADFSSATDFIGWYVHTLHTQLDIPVTDTYRIYLAYHEGVSGFKKKRFEKKPWLMRVAKKVSVQERMYHRQLAQCRVQTQA